jgi:uncharacterized protein YcfJ
MKHFPFTLAPPHRAALLGALAVIGLAGCGSPPPSSRDYPPMAQTPVYEAPHATRTQRDYRRRENETLYEVPVSAVRAVMSPASGQRCWIEREQVSQPRPRASIGGAIAGGVIGGILGHQIGGGSGRDIATVGGAVAGAAVGSNVGRNNTAPETRDVQRCTSARDAAPEYWDVSYNFRGVQHHVQLTAPPGATILVNADGEPRI